MALARTLEILVEHRDHMGVRDIVHQANASDIPAGAWPIRIARKTLHPAVHTVISQDDTGNAFASHNVSILPGFSPFLARREV